MTPNFEQLQVIISKFRECRLKAALGGSGLLYALGLTEVVHDWDLTTNEPLHEVMRCLNGFHVIEKRRVSETFRSEYILALPDEDIEIIGGYAIRCGREICHLPSIIGGAWRDVPMASPEVWAVAYDLMGRLDKAELLFGYLQRAGVSRYALELLLEEPLPSALRARLEAMTVMGSIE